jgi:hypothetical protein
MRRPVALLVLALLGAGCSGVASDDAGPTGTPSSTTSSPAATPTPGRDVAPPPNGVCYRLTYDEAVAPTVAAPPQPCRRPHTAETFAVGVVDALVDGHLLAIDSDLVQQRVAATCPDALRKHVGGTRDDVRLSMLQTVWFTPTVEDADNGADWYRCDVVAVESPETLAEVRGSLAGALRERRADDYAMCGTASPDEPGFERVACAQRHSWRAVDVVELAGLARKDGRYPGRRAVTAAGQTPCEDAGAAAAEDALDYEWAYEAPTKQQWAAGQTFGRCWAPDGG